jgi:hypothetical protein
MTTTPEAVWELLISFQEYPYWHPYLIKAEGEPLLNNKIAFTYLRSDSTEGHFKANILELEPGKLLSWGGSLGFLFEAKHYYKIVQLSDTTVQLTQGEYWRGLFGRAYGKKVYRDACLNFERQNQMMKYMLILPK